MSDNDHIDAQWLRAVQPPPRRRGRGCALSLLVLILVLAGVLFYPRVYARLTPVPAVQIQMESSVLPDTAPNCAANPRVAAVLHAAMRGQTDATVYDCDADTLEACMAELLDDPELWVRSYRYTVHGGLNAHITVTFDWVYPDDGPARREKLARTADSLEDFYARAKTKRYPHARLRRLALAAFLGLRAAERPPAAPYVRVLGLSGRGRELLRRMKETCALPVVVKPAQARALDGDARALFEAEARRTDLFGLCFPTARPCGLEWTRSPVVKERQG